MHETHASQYNDEITTPVAQAEIPTAWRGAVTKAAANGPVPVPAFCRPRTAAGDC